MRVKGLLPSPAFSAETARRFPEQVQITLHAPQAQPASFRPSTAPLPALFAAKRGFFAPNARRTRPEGRLKRLFCPGEARFFPGAPGKSPGWPRVSPGLPRPAHTPRTPEAPACAAFAPASARFLPPAAFRLPRWKPRLRRNSARQARRPARGRRQPPEGQPVRPAKASTKAEQARLPWSAFPLRRGEVCAPRGGSDPWA